MSVRLLEREREFERQRVIEGERERVRKLQDWMKIRVLFSSAKEYLRTRAASE